MDATELHRLLQQSLARKLFDLFTWRDGEITFESGTFTSAAALKVKVARLVLTGVERFVPQETIDGAIAPFAGSLFALHPDSARRAEELRPSESERKLLAALAQPRRLEELLPVSALPLAELSRAIWGLALLGLVIPADRLSSLAGRSPAEEPSTIAPTATIATQEVAAAPLPTADPESGAAEVPALAAPRAAREASGPGPEEAARIRQQVATAFEKLRHQDPYDLLAVSEAATGEEIRALYLKFAFEFAPWRFARPELQSAAPAAEELFAAGALAFARLNDAQERAALLLARRAAPAPTPPPVVVISTVLPPALSSPGAVHRTSAASFRIETDLLDPEVQYKKGRALKEGQRWSQALQQFDVRGGLRPPERRLSRRSRLLPIPPGADHHGRPGARGAPRSAAHRPGGDHALPLRRRDRRPARALRGGRDLPALGRPPPRPDRPARPRRPARPGEEKEEVTSPRARAAPSRLSDPPEVSASPAAGTFPTRRGSAAGGRAGRRAR